jgi:8-oxo-dGTP pyrophosphatase MutT (NUDIX family)
LIQIERYTTGGEHWEIPHGSSDNEDELSAAKRELQEESGLVSNNWEKIGEQEVANGWTGQLSHIYIARSVVETINNEGRDEGITTVKKVPFRIVMEMIKNGEMVESNSIAALTLTALKLGLI